MEQGINPTYKEQRKRKYEQSQQQIQTVKDQILHKKQESNIGNTDATTQSDKSKKKSKHAPTLMSSKRSEFYHRQRLDLQGGGVSAIGTNIQAHTNIYKGRDPRSIIDVTASSTNDQKYSHSKRGGKKLLESIKGTSNNMNDHQYEDYAFIQEMRNEEMQTLQKRIKARQLTGRKGQEQRRRYNVQNDDDGLINDQRELHQLQQEKANFERKLLDIATKRAVQQRLRETNVTRRHNHTNEVASETGHQIDDDNDDDVHHPPTQKSSKYVPKVRELKRMYLETKYDLLSQQQKGKNTIDKMILKKHIKNKSKDSKKHHI
jgi:rRNA biogenesis protein RRP36